MDNNLLMIFIKNPVEGKVKTRLAAAIGSANALLVYKKLLVHTREVAANISCDHQVWYSSMVDRTDSWSSEQFDKKRQRGSDLGERMSNAFRMAFENGYKKVVIIGSDCAGLTPGHIERAFHDLETHDAVIGPSEDGGYYLLGTSEFRPDIFSDVKWSTSTVFKSTEQHFRRLGLSYSTLEVLNDIDTIEDLKQSDMKLP